MALSNRAATPAAIVLRLDELKLIKLMILTWPPSAGKSRACKAVLTTRLLDEVIKYEPDDDLPLSPEERDLNTIAAKSQSSQSGCKGTELLLTISAPMEVYCSMHWPPLTMITLSQYHVHGTMTDRVNKVIGNYKRGRCFVAAGFKQFKRLDGRL